MSPIPPKRTAEQRAAALAKARHARELRAALKQQVAQGDLSIEAVFERAETDEVVANIKLLTLLEAVPYIGKIRSRRMLAALEISERRRLRGVGQHQRQRLFERIAQRARDNGSDS